MKQLRGSGKVAGAVLLLLLILFFGILVIFSGWIRDWLWMNQVGYIEVFWRILSIRLALAVIAGLVAFFYLWLNLGYAAKHVYRLYGRPAEGNIVLYTRQGIVLPKGLARLGAIVLAAVVGIIFA
ncbi:MAG: UPF0182 family protein, partial [Desulfosarcinaceae bacterium]